MKEEALPYAVLNIGFGEEGLSLQMIEGGTQNKSPVVRIGIVNRIDATQTHADCDDEGWEKFKQKLHVLY